jgi:hypothetical protein
LPRIGASHTRLAKNLQKEPTWPAPEAITKKAAELKEKGMVNCYGTRLGRFVMDSWSAATGKKFSGNVGRQSVSFTTEDGNVSTAAWDEFTSSGAFELMAKYAALADTLASAPITDNLFETKRALGRGAFGAVFLTFKKVRSWERSASRRVAHTHTLPRALPLPPTAFAAVRCACVWSRTRGWRWRRRR